jgi:hypothetical protein
LAHLPVEFLERSEREVGMTDLTKLNACGLDTGFHIGNSEDDDGVTMLLESARKRGEWVEVSCAGKTKCA